MSDQIQEPVFEQSPYDADDPYTVVPNALIRDETISPECRWLIIYLSSNSKNWVIKQSQVRKHLNGFIGRDKLRRIVNEAIDAGYMKREGYSEDNLRRYRTLVSKFKKFLPRTDFQGPDGGAPKDKASKEVIREELTNKESLVDAVAPTKKSSQEEELENHLFSSIKAKKPDFTKTSDKNWSRFCSKLLKIRDLESLKRTINWCVNDDFWFANVLSPNGLFKNINVIEAKMKTAKPSIKQMGDMADIHRKQAEKHEMREGICQIVALREAVEMIRGPICKVVRYDVSQAEWEEKTGWKNE